MVVLLTWVATGALPARAAAAPPEPTGRSASAARGAQTRWGVDALRVTISDDRFRKADDAGFTSYEALAIELSRGLRERFTFRASNQLITERGGMRRVDEGHVIGEYGRRTSWAGLEVELSAHAGLSLGGNLGGAQMQDGFHALVGGHRLGGLLQDQYPGRTRVGAVAGGAVRARWPADSPVAIAGDLGGNLDLGGGVSRMDVSLGLVLASRHLRAEVGEGVSRYFTNDRFLTMPGGYVTGIFANAPYLRLAVRVRGFEIEYEARANAGGSGQAQSQASVRFPLP